MKPTRRRFLAAAAPAATGLAALASMDGTSAAERPTSQPRVGPRSAFDPWVEIHRGHLASNVGEISRRAGGRPILAVVKNNGYGMGLPDAARLLEPLAPVAGFAVVKLDEAVTLRDAGIRKPVLLMGPFDDGDLGEIAARDIMPMVYTPAGDALDRVAKKIGRAIRIHVCVDTGIGRVGVPYRDALPLIRDLAARRSVTIGGLMMTFSEDTALDEEQKRRFAALVAALDADRIATGLKHAASSFALFQHPDAFYDMVRPGMALFGVYSEQAFRSTSVMDLRPAMALRTRVAYLKQLRRGESAGYNRGYVARDDVWVATLPAGHADGWPRAAASGARVRIGGRSYPVIASVSASHTIVEIGSEPRVAIGDEATLWDWEPGSRPEDVGAACQASVYDLTMHLNPLLRRTGL